MTPMTASSDWGHPVLGGLLRVQQASRRRPWVLDTAVVLAVAFAASPDLVAGDRPGGYRPESVVDLPLGVLAALAVMFAVPLWWRRSAPVVVFAVVAPLSVGLWAAGLWAQAGVGVLVTLYGLAARGTLRVLGWVAAVTLAGLWVGAWFAVPAEQRVPALVLITGNLVAAVTLGLIFRFRRLYLAALEDRATRLETERDQRERLIAAAERSRVAREMHDIVGHNLSVMVGLADGAATLAASREEKAAGALRIIGDTGRQAMTELRRVLGVLREGADDVELSPQPGVEDLDTLLTRVGAAGLTVTYRTTGNIGALGPGVQLAVYRIVQEALTNTLRHAGTGSSAEVTVAAEDGRVRVRVTDTGPVHGARTVGEPGHGLVGIRQRAALYDGTVTIGPRGHGWLVDVHLDTPGEP